MPRLGLLNPKNFIESSGGGFKEGDIRVDKSVFKVHQGRSAEDQPTRQPALALVWSVTRLDEDKQPLVNDDGEPIHEELIFGLGGTSLAKAHPGNASGSGDEAEDLGVEVNTEGPTIFLVSQDFNLNKKSGCAVLMKSIQDAGWKDEHLDATWSPSFDGAIFKMKTFIDDTMKVPDGKGGERSVGYKVVDKVISRPYEQKASAKSSSKSSPGGSNGANPEAEQKLRPILEQLSTDLDGQRLTRKAVTMKISQMLQNGDHKADQKLHVPILSLVKDDKWLSKNGPGFDLAFTPADNSIVFGTLKE